MKVIVFVVFLIMLAACSLPQTKNTDTNMLEHTISIRHRDLLEQTRSGNGEGMAKAVPGQPLLVNNQLIFSMPDNVALGIAIAVGAIDRTLAEFKGMQSLAVLDWSRQAITEYAVQPEWQMMLQDIQRNQQHMILEPYCYLDGYPEATLEVRVLIRLHHAEQVLWTGQLLERAEAMPLTGSESWSAEGGAVLVDFTRQVLPVLLGRLPALVAEKRLDSVSMD